MVEECVEAGAVSCMSDGLGNCYVLFAVVRVVTARMEIVKGRCWFIESFRANDPELVDGNGGV